MYASTVIHSTAWRMRVGRTAKAPCGKPPPVCGICVMGPGTLPRPLRTFSSTVSGDMIGVTMQINPKKCVACGNCTYVCPMGAIYIDPAKKRATIDQDECVECYTCFTGLSQEPLPPTLVRGVRKVFAALRIRFEPEPDVCPTAAFEPDELAWPRVVRRAFSDPRVPHESTGVERRGTEEVKTNDVTGRVGPGEIGFTIELGRPGVGVRFRDIQEMCLALAAAGVAFEKKNPITSLMSDVATGTI